ncbi:MAG TPA: hypothetical protein DEH11_09100 [Actinobacteria bacterium]|jgi:steroid delta-isomerase-like uncharacterized protein|nr:hypothetical protein [Actinomycetota bacterium]
MRREGPAGHRCFMTTSAEADLREVRERIIRSHLDAECRHDIAAALATFAEANYDVIPLGAPSNGAAAVEELLAALFAAFPDFSADMRALHHGDDIVFVDTTMRGTHRGTWAGVPASGRPIEVRCGCVFHFEDDRLVKQTVYFDHATLLAQIGVSG